MTGWESKGISWNRYKYSEAKADISAPFEHNNETIQLQQNCASHASWHQPQIRSTVPSEIPNSMGRHKSSPKSSKSLRCQLSFAAHADPSLRQSFASTKWCLKWFGKCKGDSERANCPWCNFQSHEALQICVSYMILCYIILLYRLHSKYMYIHQFHGVYTDSKIKNQPSQFSKPTDQLKKMPAFLYHDLQALRLSVAWLAFPPGQRGSQALLCALRWGSHVFHAFAHHDLARSKSRQVGPWERTGTQYTYVTHPRRAINNKY